MKPTHRANKPQILGTVIGLLLATLNSTQAQRTIVSDFDDGVPDWDNLQNRGATFLESDGHLVASGNIPAKTDCITRNLSHVLWNRSLAVNEGEVLRLGVDLIESSHDDVQVLLDYQATGTGGYSVAKDEDEIWLTKWQWVDCGANAPFFYEQVPVKNERVRLVLEVKGVAAGLEITSKVLDLEAGNAVLFTKTVTDTTAVDPTISSFRGYTWSADSGSPILEATAVNVSVLNVAKTAASNVRVVFDNFAYERQPKLSVEKALRLSWPASFPDMEVLGAATVNGPWTPISEPVMKSGGTYQMTVPAPVSETLRVFRLEKGTTP